MEIWESSSFAELSIFFLHQTFGKNSYYLKEFFLNVEQVKNLPPKFGTQVTNMIIFEIVKKNLP